MFLPQCYNLNKLGKGPIGDAVYPIQVLCLVVSNKKIFNSLDFEKNLFLVHLT